mmetsp:Transcript_117882/g.380459  ORF Transcript_117882/g.380459 Transcript_117882/m.380459 type:complete len:205 (+) Transcript_117882:40-654(+)
MPHSNRCALTRSSSLLASEHSRNSCPQRRALSAEHPSRSGRPTCCGHFDLHADAIQHRQGLGDDVARVQLRIVVHEMLVIVVNPAIGQNHAAEDEWLPAAAVQEASLQQGLLDLRREAADGVLLHGDERTVVGGEPAEELRIQGLHPPRVRHRGRDAHVLQLLSGLEALAEAAAHREDCQAVVAALAGNAALAGLQEARLRRQL